MSKSPNGDARVDGCGEDCVLGGYLDTTLMERDEARAERDTLRTAVSDAATERVTENSVRHVKRLTAELQNKRESLNDQRREFRKLLANARAERDAALAAVDRVRKVVKQWSPAESYPRDEVLAALDGAPEPEWEYGRKYVDEAGDPRIRVSQDVTSPDGHRSDGTLYWNYQPVRRRKAGPWLLAEGESK